MFIDELFEKYLIEDGLTYGDAIQRVCEEKIDENHPNLGMVKKIEYGYLLFCKKHPDAPKDMIRTYVSLRSPKICEALGWDK